MPRNPWINMLHFLAQDALFLSPDMQIIILLPIIKEE